jgi:PAS domain-containing protein
VLDHSVLSLQKDVHGLPQWSEIATAILNSQCFRFRGRHRHQQGHEVDVEVNTTHFELDGRAYFLSIARDTTNRVAQEADVHNREKQLWFALNEASDGLWDWDVASGSLFFSPQLKRMLGYGPDEMAPELADWSNNVHPVDAPLVMAALEEHMQGKRSRYEAENASVIAMAISSGCMIAAACVNSARMENRRVWLAWCRTSATASNSNSCCRNMPQTTR